MTRNDEVPQEVGEAIDSLLAAERTLVRAEEKVGPYYAGARLLHDEMFAQETARDALETVIRDHIRAKLEAAEGEVARLREDAEKWRAFIAGVDAEQAVAASEKFGDALGALSTPNAGGTRG